MSMYEYSYVDYVVSHAQIEKEKQSLKKKKCLMYVQFASCVQAVDQVPFSDVCFLFRKQNTSILFVISVWKGKVSELLFKKFKF